LGYGICLAFDAPVPRTIYTREQEQLTALLRHIRLDAGLRKEDRAKRIRRPQSFVSKYEIGPRRLDLVELRDTRDGSSSREPSR